MPEPTPKSEGERNLLAAFKSGADCQLGDAVPQDPADGVTVRAGFLRDLIVLEPSTGGAPVSGVRLTGAYVTGPLALAGLRIDFPLLLQKCRLEAIDLTDANLSTLNLAGSHCAGITADRVRFDSGMLLGSGFVSSRMVFLRNANIGGDLYCAGAKFSLGEEDGWALLFDGARIGGRMFMNSVTVNGPFQGGSARIEGGLLCLGATFDHGQRGAVRLARIRVAGRVTFKDAEIRGRLNLSHGSIGGQLDLEGVRCTRAPSDGSVKMDGLAVGGAASFRQVETAGRVRFRGGSVGGELDFSGANLTGNGAGHRSLELAGTRVGGRVVLKGLQARGGVTLTGAAIGLDVTGDDQTSVDGGSGVAVALNRARVGGNVELTGCLSGRPALHLTSTRIEGDLDLRGGQLVTDDKPPAGYDGPVAARGEGLTVRGSILADGVQVTGGDLRLPRIEVGGDVHLSRAEVRKGAVVLGAARIGGRLEFKESEFIGAGRQILSLESAQVEGGFAWTPRSVPDRAGIDLSHASVGYLKDERCAWPYDLDLHLGGFSYRDTQGPMELDDRLRWIQIETKERYSPQPYEQLIGVLRQAGSETDARTAARQKQTDARSTLPWHGRVVNCLHGFTLGYGYQLWRVLVGALVVFVVGAIVFHLAGGSHDMYVVKHDGNIPGFSALSYSLDSLLPVVNLHQEDYRLPSGIASAYLGLHIVTGWVLTTLLAFGLTGLARRD
jgi:hypothetical protein